MEKRFVNFMVMSMLIMTTYMMLQAWMNPRPADPDPADQQVAEVDDEANEQDGAADDEGRPNDDPDVPALPKQQEPRRIVSIGSIDAASPYRMQAVINSKGGTVEAIELSGSRYTSDEDQGAYLGYLSVANIVTGGCEINVVPAGSPASKAVPVSGDAGVGLLPKDVIVRVNETSIESAPQLAEVLGKLKPKSQLKVTVIRGEGELTFDVQSMRRPMAVIRPEPTFAEQQHPLSFLWTFDQIGQKSASYNQDELPGIPSLRDEDWHMEVHQANGIQTVELSYVLDSNDLKPFGVAGDLKVIKRYQLAPYSDDKSQDERSGYHLSLDIEVQNLSTEPIDFGYRFDGPTGLPLEGWWYSYKTHPTQWGRAGVRDVVWKADDSGHLMFRNAVIAGRKKKKPEDPETSMVDRQRSKEFRMTYAGVDAQYFTVGLLPNRENENDPSHVYTDALARVVGEVDDIRESRTDVSYRLVSRPITLPAGESFKESFTIYAGPKKPEILAEYGLDQVISYGWFPMVAKPLQGILHFFHNTMGLNYGLAIILLTVLVRGCMYPLGRKQAANAKKMQELGPEMKKLAEKYKNDMEKRAAAQQELFRKHNCHPLSGCLPSLVQLPIFVGLYKALSVDIELRQAALIPGIQWCSNLAAPDRLWHWEFLPLFGFNSPTGMLGPYLNVLPLISAALFLVQQKLLMPPPTDEQQEMQQQMMKFMPIMMCFIFWKVPAGLCIYFIASSLWGLAERKLLPKTPTEVKAIEDKKGDDPPKDSIMAKLNPNKPKPAPNGASKKRERAERAKRRAKS